ncbi:MAG: 4Fe-4S dicluster domain-containing protein [Nitrososphaeria archaeon]
MQRKILVVDPEKCTGCRICEPVCSLAHGGACNPAEARIGVVNWYCEGISVPMVCQHCEKPPCTEVCPTNALKRNSETGAILIDPGLCMGCRMCLVVCPFGALSLKDGEEIPIKCDLCNGEAKCASFCPTGAIQYISATQTNMSKRRAAADRISELLRRAVKT